MFKLRATHQIHSDIDDLIALGGVGCCCLYDEKYANKQVQISYFHMRTDQLCVKLQKQRLNIYSKVINCNDQSYTMKIQEKQRNQMSNRIVQAAHKLSECGMLLIGAGAGIGKDSGLPDFRGNEGFWNNYPPYRDKFNFQSCANPAFLESNPNLFWGFYGTRLQMYRQKKPHQGFNILKRLSDKMNYSFVVTSNVDGHFQRIFNEKQVYEVHGSIHYLQCSSCCQLTENKFIPDIDYKQMSCRNLPKCEKCKNNLRPNILMFGDWDWMGDRSQEQSGRFDKFSKAIETQNKKGKKLGIIQIGCGTAIPTIRNICEKYYYNQKDSIFIRINPDEEQESHKQMNRDRYFHIKLGALQALQSIEKNLKI